MARRALHLRRAFPLIHPRRSAQNRIRVASHPHRYPSPPQSRFSSMCFNHGSLGESKTFLRSQLPSPRFCSTMETVSESEWSESDDEDLFRKRENELSEDSSESERRDVGVFGKKTQMKKDTNKKKQKNVVRSDAFETDDEASEEEGEETDFGIDSDREELNRFEDNHRNGCDSNQMGGKNDRLGSRQGRNFDEMNRHRDRTDGNYEQTGGFKDQMRENYGKMGDRRDWMGGNYDRVAGNFDQMSKPRDRDHSKKYIQDSDSDDIEVESDSEDELQAEVERQMAAEPKVVRPSVTWGILLSNEHRKIARKTVLTYLESEGIHTSELKSIELPTTLDVMKTRLGFLRKLGLTNDDINSYPLALGCSVYKNMVPVLRYLKKIGIKEHCVTGLLRKYPMVLHSSVVIDILPVIYFLRGLDIDPVDLPPVLTRYPDVLGFKTDGTMSTSVAYLVSMGVKMRHVGRMLTEYPEVLGMRVATVIKPKFEYLMSLGMPQTIVTSVLERRPQILGYDLESRMKYNVSQLVGIGVREEFVPGMIAQFPELLGRVFSPSLAMQVDWLKQNLVLDLDGVSKMIEKMPQVIFLKEEVAMGRIRFLKSQRFAPKEIGVMASQCPQLLVLSIDESLKPNFTFLTRDMKRTRQDVIEFPACLTYGLETRIKPRFKALGEKHGEYSLEWILNCSDGKFQRRLARGCVDEEEKEKAIGHMFVMGGLLPGKLENEQKPSAIKTRLEASLSSVNTCSQLLPKRGFQLVTI